MSLFSSIAKLAGVGGPALAYTLGEPYREAWGPWTHYAATSNADGSPASVFKLTAADPNDLKLAAARNGVKRLRMVRVLARCGQQNGIRAAAGGRGGSGARRALFAVQQPLLAARRPLQQPVP